MIFTVVRMVIKLRMLSQIRDNPRIVTMILMLSLGLKISKQPKAPVTIANISISHHSGIPNGLASMAIPILNIPSVKIRIPKTVHRNDMVASV